MSFFFFLMAGDCKRGRTKIIEVKVSKENGPDRGLDWEAGMAYQLNFQTAAYEK